MDKIFKKLSYVNFIENQIVIIENNDKMQKKPIKSIFFLRGMFISFMFVPA